MDDDVPPLVKEPAGDAAKRSLVDDVRQLAEDGRTLLEAELAYQKSRAAVAGASAGGIASWGSLALALLFFALMALVVGLLLALGAVVGEWAALAIVVLGLLLAAAASGLVASRRWKRMRALLSDKGGAP